MEAMIKNDEEKVWMTPLLELRNELDKPDDRDRRDFRRMNGTIQLFHGRPIPGPYTKEWRERWLRKLLEAQQSIRRDGPDSFATVNLITPEELHEIRRIWLYEKHEFDDRLPQIYEEVVGERFPKRDDDDNSLRADDWELLREICDGDEALFDLQVALLGVERDYRGMSRRAGVFEALEECLRTGMYGSEDEAIEVLTDRRDKLLSLDVINNGPRCLRRHRVGRAGCVMILRELRLTNFGLFRGDQKFELSPAGRNGTRKPIVLFGGMNGGGKTTIFDGMQLALYGSRARCSKRAGRSYEDFLRDSINSGVPPETGAGVALTFSIATNGVPSEYEIKRDWRLTEGKVKESLIVHRDGFPAYSQTRRWAQLVE